MTAYDLILYILDGEGGNEQQTIELVNELATSILSEHEDSTWGKSLLKEIYEFAISHGRCPYCGSRLVYKQVKGDTVEYFGLPVNEDLTDATCQECDYVFEF